MEQHVNSGGIWPDIHHRQHDSRPTGAAIGRPRSVVICDLPSAGAPLWRNAPSHPTHLPPSQPLPASQLHQLQQRKPTPPVSFQQSLRSYPTPASTATQRCANQQISAKNNSCSASPKDYSKQNIQQPQGSRFFQKSSTANSNESRCHVTNLDGEQSTPFFLDYLDSQSLHNNPMTVPTIGAFNHRTFMEMFREPDSVPPVSNESGSLPYAVNAELNVTANQITGLGVDSLASQASDQSFYQTNKTTTQRRTVNSTFAGPPQATRCTGAVVGKGKLISSIPFQQIMISFLGFVISSN